VFDFTPPAGALQPLDRLGQPVYAPRSRRWPVFSNVWGSTTSMIYQYAALPFVAAWGLNGWTVRLPAAISGFFTILLALFLARKMSGRDDVALWTGLLLAFSPWHLVFSRWALQGIFVPLLLTGGYLSLAGWSRDRGRFARLAGAALLFALGFYAYAGARPFLILLGLWTAFLWRKDLAARPKAAAGAALLLILGIAPTLAVMFLGGGEGMGRFQAVSVFGLDAPFWRKALVFLTNYLRHFSPLFLFLPGDANPRHSLPGFGVMLHVEAVFLLAGIWLGLKRRSRADLLLLGWFLLAPVSAALTREGIPHALRTLHAVPAPQILAAIGAVAAVGWAGRRFGTLGRIGIAGLWGLNAAAMVFVLFWIYPVWSAPHFEYGIGEAFRGVDPVSGDRGVRHVATGPLLPYVFELYYFHVKSDPRRVLEEGFAGSGVRLYPPGMPPRIVLEQVRAGESLLVSSADFLRFYGSLIRGPGWETRAILWPATPFEDSPREALRLIRREMLP